MNIDPPIISKEDIAKVKFKIKNTGDRAGEEVPQLYIRDLVASVTRPVMELKGFQRIPINPGEEKNVVFEISKEHLFLLSEQMEEVVESGDFKIMIGGSSKDIRLRGFLQVIK